ncbi:MAG TPA: DUF2796 domain-containing protein, partial [Gammaproteobacteria bacterium]|nr:DUF2796 domain-containing protein [Gammaproteobacteria bacterium]
MQHFSLRAVTVALFAAWGVAQADVERDLDSHEHGAASLNLVVDGNRVFVEFSSPWANVAGFEHAPSTQEQHAVVDKALADLADADALMVFTGTRCARVDSQVSSTMGEGGSEHDHHDEHKEHE